MRNSAPATMDAAKLRAWRDAHGLSQWQLGQALGVHPNTIARWERGTTEIGQPHVLYLALAMLDRMILPEGTPLPPEAD